MSLIEPPSGPRPQSLGVPPELQQVVIIASAACGVGILLMLINEWRWLGLLIGGGATFFLAWTAWRAPRMDAAPEAEAEPPPPRAAERAAVLSEMMGPVLEALPDPALLIDANRQVVAANAAARRMMGFSAPGLRLSAVLRRPELLDAADAAIDSGATLAVDYEVTLPAEEHFRVFVAPVKFPTAAAALLVFQDQTSVINTERMRADFLANASHELRTPLAALTLLLETLQGHARNDPEAQQRFLKMMFAQAARMRELIDDLLSLSKIELNEHVPPSDEVDLVALIKEMIDRVGPLAQGRRLSFALAAEAPEMLVTGDRNQLAQVAQNLLDNAVKYSAEDAAIEVALGFGADREEAAAKGGRLWPDASRVSLLTPPPAAGRTYAYLRVADSGAGIARRHLPRLSERFYRVEREEGAEQSGTGLGLAIVKHIINRHRGGFIVESQQGKGSAFAVYLECAQAAPARASAVS